jgi:hypothetical protein
MATNYTTPQDQQFKDAWKAQASGSNAKDFGGDWPTRNTFNEKLDYVKRYYTSADTKNKDLALKLGVEWLQSNLPKGLLKADGTPYEIADYQNIILPTKTVQGTATIALNNAMFSAAKDIVNGTNTTKQSSQLVALAAGDLIGAGASSSYNPDAFIKGFNTVVAPTLVTPSGSLADIKKQYGSLYDKSGKPLFSDTELKNVYNGSPDALQSFRSKLNTAVEDAVKATDPSFAKAGSNQGSAYVTARNRLLSDPAGNLAQNYNTNVSGLKASDTGGWVTSSGTVVGGPASTDTVVGGPASTDTVVGGPVTTGNGITGLLPKGSYKDANGNFAYTGGQIEPDKMTEFTQSYNPNKGVYRAPSLDASGKLDANSTSPYSNILNGMLSGYKNPYAAGYTNQLKMPETPDLTNIKKPFENNPTSKDLLKLANTAGQPYDPKAITSLSPALSKIYQPSITNSAGKATKPGAPDTTNTTLPVVPKAGEPIVTDTSVGKVVTDTDTDTGAGKVTSPPVKTAAELAAEKAEADRLAAEKAAVVTTPGKLTFQPVDGVVVSAEERAKNLEAARIAQEAVAKRQAEEKAEAERQAGLVALANQQAADKAAAEWEYNSNKAREETAAWEARQKAEVERQAGIKTLAERTAAEKASYGPISSFYGGLSPAISLSPPVVETIAPAQRDLGPQQITLSPSAVVSPSGINALSAQTVALPPSGPQPINPSNGGPTSAIVDPITAAQRDLGPLNISNLGAVIGPQAMNSNAGGVASLVGPQVTVQPQPQPAVTYTSAHSDQQQLEDKAVNAGYQGDYTDTAAMNSFIKANNQSVAPAVTQQPAVQASAVPSTQVLDSSGTPIPGRRRLGFA